MLCYASLILPVVPRFSDSLPSLLLVPLAQLRRHPSSFRSLSFHFPTGIPIPPAVLVSLLLIRVLFLFSIALSQYPALFPSAHSVLELCHSHSRFHSQLAPLHSSLTMYLGVSRSTPSTPLKYFSCTLSTSSCSFHPRFLLRISARSLRCSRTS
jgi:hypothetical protein